MHWSLKKLLTSNFLHSVFLKWENDLLSTWSLSGHWWHCFLFNYSEKISSSLAYVVKKSLTCMREGHHQNSPWRNAEFRAVEKKLEVSDVKYALLMRTMFRITFVRKTVRALNGEIKNILTFLLIIFSSKIWGMYTTAYMSRNWNLEVPIIFYCLWRDRWFIQMLTDTR